MQYSSKKGGYESGGGRGNQIGADAVTDADGVGTIVDDLAPTCRFKGGRYASID